MSYTLDPDRLEKMLNEVCEKLISNGAMLSQDKEKAVSLVKEALINTYPDGVPQDIFTNPIKQQNLIFGLISAPLKDKHPDLNFDLETFFKANLNPEETKKLFKTFLTALNKLEPDPNKRRSDKQIDEEVDNVLNQMKMEEQEAEELLRLVDSKAACKFLEETFQSLFGITRGGQRVILTVDKGQGQFIDDIPASALGGGSIHAGRGFSGDSTTDPYVTAMADERLLDMGGLSAEELQGLMKRGILHKAITNEPRQG